MCVIDVGWAEDAERFQCLHTQDLGSHLGLNKTSGPQQDIWGIESQWGRPHTPIFMTVKYSPAHLF